MGLFISGYRNLIVWQEAKKLVILVYKLTEKFPKPEQYGLISQMRRAAVSILSNIAEGWLRRSSKDKLHYLEISEGSLLELESEAEVANELQYFSQEGYQKFDRQRAKVAFLLYQYKHKIELNSHP